VAIPVVFALCFLVYASILTIITIITTCTPTNTNTNTNTSSALSHPSYSAVVAKGLKAAFGVQVVAASQPSDQLDRRLLTDEVESDVISGGRVAAAVSCLGPLGPLEQRYEAILQ
jgi:hypothetical protein